MKMILILFAFLNLAQAQYHEQPQKESSLDLRSQIILFRIEVAGEKRSFMLERNAAQDYLLRLHEKEEEQLRKLSRHEALGLEKDFVSRFLKCQYELTNRPGECEVTLRLSLKGEEQVICKKDDQKSLVIESFLKELAKRF